MKKKAVLLLTTFSAVGLATATLFAFNSNEATFARGTDQPSTITLSSSSAVHSSSDDSLLAQANVKNNKFDFIGYSSEGGLLGSIQKGEAYRGMVYNRSVINGFNSLEVKFSGGPLSYVFTDFLMEDMTFNHGTALVSEQAVQVPEGKAYFLVFTTDDSKVNLDYVKVTYDCDHSIDNQMIYNKNTTLGGARSLAKKTVLEDSFIELENNPTKYTNNYSTGKHEGHTNNDSWYRFNGRYFYPSEELGTNFDFAMTIMGSYEMMQDESQFFHYNFWPQFSYGNSNDEPWTQLYIGNDNYEPLGKDHALRPSDPYTKDSFAGRFFTNYDWYNDNWEIDYSDPTGSWKFADPDIVKVPDPLYPDLTYRQAYEMFNMPFWYVRFHVYLNEENDAWADIYINNVMIYSTYIFEDYDTVNTPSIHIHTLPMHLINYGVDAEGNPAPSYKGSFTYPRLIEKESGSKKFYFTNNYYWDNLKAYVWNSSTGEKLSDWPGSGMTYEYTNDFGQAVYSIDVDLDKYDSIIFNSNGAQTVDIPLSIFEYHDAVGAYLLETKDDQGHYKVALW